MNSKNKGSKNILNIWIGKQKFYGSRKIPKGTNLMLKWQNIKGQSSIPFYWLLMSIQVKGGTALECFIWSLLDIH